MTDKNIKSNTVKPTKRSSRVRSPTVNPNTSPPSSHPVCQPSNRHHPYATSNISQQVDRCRRSTSTIVRPTQKVVHRGTGMPAKASALSTSSYYKSLPPPPRPPSILARTRIPSPPPPMAQQQQQRRSPLVHPRVRQLRLPDEGLSRPKRSKQRPVFKKQKQDQDMKQFIKKLQCTGETMAQMERRLRLEFNVPLVLPTAEDKAREAEEERCRRELVARHVASVEPLRVMVAKRAEEYRLINERYERSRAGAKEKKRKREEDEKGPEDCKKRT
ncbi:MAG: hypothetical protein EXX96DRAFT_574152 [Benjaminiella poitrasii]|nr:MAG: hypothetical protein EXX96DRAFT_574152 [Benjaminiella poitrasii]